MVSNEQSVPATVGLLSRRSLTGASVVLISALLFIIGLPWLNQALDDNAFAAGQPYTVADSYTITPADGWALDSESEFFTIFEKSGATLVLTGATDAESPPEEQIELNIAGLENDSTATWVIGEPTTFVTDSGVHGVSLTAHSETLAAETWIISDGERSITVISQVPDSVWPSIAGELDDMAASVDLSQEPSGS